MEFEERALLLNMLGYVFQSFSFSFLVLGIELKALHVLGKYFPTEWYHHPCSDIF